MELHCEETQQPETPRGQVCSTAPAPPGGVGVHDDAQSLRLLPGPERGSRQHVRQARQKPGQGCYGEMEGEN